MKRSFSSCGVVVDAAMGCFVDEMALTLAKRTGGMAWYGELALGSASGCSHRYD